VPEIRCNSKLHGVVSDNSKGIFEVVCNSRWCRIGNEVVMHRFNLEKTTEDGCIMPVETLRFKRPE